MEDLKAKKAGASSAIACGIDPFLSYTVYSCACLLSACLLSGMAVVSEAIKSTTHPQYEQSEFSGGDFATKSIPRHEKPHRNP